jgi:hypothetical protein
MSAYNDPLDVGSSTRSKGTQAPSNSAWPMAVNAGDKYMVLFAVKARGYPLPPASHISEGHTKT